MGQNSGLLSSLTDWNSTLAGYADSISTGVVMPVALTLLALFMILELYNATQRIAMNGSNNAFTIQQIALVMLKIVVCRWAVAHTTEILNALFEIASTVTVGISGYVGSGEVNTTVDIENAIAALPGGIGNMPVALELMVVGWMLRIVNIVVNTIVAARFIELYVYNAMASLSIATLCYQELHGIAVNFLKSYLAVALQGAVLYLVIGFYPALAGSLGTGGSIESPLQAGAGALNYHEDFDTDAVQNAGLHMAVAHTVVEGNIMAAAANSAFVIGKQTGNILKDLKDETINAKDALKAGGKVLRLQGGKSVGKIGGATLRSTEQYLSSFQVSTDDFTGSVPGKIKEAATNTGKILKKITNVVLHPLRNLIAMGKVILIGAVILLFLSIVSLLGQMSGTTSTSVFCANRIEDVQTLVQKINDYRNAAVTEGIYQAFQNDVDPNGNPYGYDSLTGQRSNNLQHGVTWNYASGIYNDTAEIISLAAVYYQQDWPRSELLSAFSDNVPFTKFCRALAAYGLDVTARESAPYSCMSYGGCVNGYRSEGEMVSIKDYRLETHTCSEGDDACGQYDAAAEWHWNEGHAENRSYSIWKEDGTHDVTVFFPIIFPDGATGSALSDLPEEYNAVADGKIKAADCTGNIVLDESANLYKGELNDWFYTPDELTVTFTVVTGEGDDAVSDDYEVAFTNATAIPWCPGELNDGQYGHYDLSCTIYLTGYDRYTDPETQAPNGADGGTGNLEALAESCDAGTLTRTIIKQDQYGNEYAGNAVSARYTKTITLPNGASGFQGWYKDGEDTYGNVEWASLLYRMDWEELYGIVDGIKCRATGSGMTEEELRQLFASLNIDATTARGQVVAFALSCQGKFVYAQPSSLRGGPGSPSVGINLDCSSFVQYCYWAQNLPFSAGSTAAYRNAADLVSISTSEVQPGDLRVVYASGGEQGHVQMALGGDAWIECCYGYGVAVNMSNAWMESRPCYYFRYAGF